MPRHDGDRGGGVLGTESDLRADGELALEDGQRLFLALLFQVDGGRIDDLGDGDAGGRVDGQHGRDERRIARRVRLGVQALRQRDLQREADARAGAGGRRLDERRDGGLRTLDLRPQRRHGKDDDGGDDGGSSRVVHLDTLR